MWQKNTNVYIQETNQPQRARKQVYKNLQGKTRIAKAIFKNNKAERPHSPISNIVQNYSN